MTSWIITAAPEFLAGVDAFFGDTLNHGLAAQGTGGSILLNILLGAIGQTFSSETLSEATFSLKGFQLAFYLSSQHLNQPLTEHQDAVGYQQGVVAI